MRQGMMAASLKSSGLVFKTHTLKINALYQATSGGYAFKVDTQVDGDVYTVHVSLKAPEGGATTVMTTVTLNETLNVPKGTKKVRVYDWRTGQLFEEYTL
ncbi:MAG: hypothetical protein GC134_01530 [Proteobacteria bacterium]|nr:hypothetical protein [Pseudomonadota bacterium]